MVQVGGDRAGQIVDATYLRNLFGQYRRDGVSHVDGKNRGGDAVLSGRINSSLSRTPAAAKNRKKPSMITVGRTVTTGRPVHSRACSASQCSLCCGLLVVSMMLFYETVICDMFTKSSTP